ncbi:hypothetical protein MMC30_008853 [Trapelia coarctata]|nr:hypothetical protein [Trapelia coarctata]
MGASNNNGLLPSAFSDHTPRDGFTDLPAELILHIMNFIAVDDLPSFVLTSHATYKAWKGSEQIVFDKIFEIRYPEFQTYFGRMPGFLTGHDAANASHQMSMLRTEEQNQTLVAAVVQNRALGIQGFGTYHEIARGGWSFLIMLGRLSRVLDEDLIILREIPVCGEMEIGVARRALLLLWRLRWEKPWMNSSGSLWTESLCWPARTSIVRQQPEAMRRALRHILRLIITVLIDSPVLSEALKLSMKRYPGQMRALSIVPLQESEVRAQMLERKKHLLMDLSLRYGLRMMIILSRLDAQEVILTKHKYVLDAWVGCIMVHFGSVTLPEVQEVTQQYLKDQATFREVIDLGGLKQMTEGNASSRHGC